MTKPIHIGHTLAFNSLTTAMAAASFAYVQEKFAGQETTLGKARFLVLLGVFAYAFIKGVLVAGKAADFADTVKETEDAGFKKLGRHHTFSLLFGLAGVAVWFVLLEFGVADARANPTCTSALTLSDGSMLVLEHACDVIKPERGSDA